MKRFKAFFLALALTTVFAGNIFAASSLVSTVTMPTSLIAYAFNALLSLARADDQCPLRQCTNCRPNTGDADNDNGNGNCRPNPD